MTINAPTASPPSCQTRMPNTTPPMPTTENRAPTRSMPFSPVNGTSRIIRMFSSTTAITTSSSAKPTRHDRNVVMKPPTSGPTAAAMAAAAPTRAYTFFWVAPSKLP